MERMIIQSSCMGILKSWWLIMEYDQILLDMDPVQRCGICSQFLAVSVYQREEMGHFMGNASIKHEA